MQCPNKIAAGRHIGLTVRDETKFCRKFENKICENYPLTIIVTTVISTTLIALRLIIP